MATATLQPTNLLFGDGTNDRCKITVSANAAARFSGHSDAAVELQNIADAASNSSAAPLSQVTGLISAQEVTAAAARAVVAATAAGLVTTEENARIAADAAAATVNANARGAVATAAAALVTTEENARIAADAAAATVNADARTVIQSALTQEINNRGAADTAAATTTANNLANAQTTNAAARTVIANNLTAETTRATAAEAQALVDAKAYSDTKVAAASAAQTQALNDAVNGIQWKQSCRVASAVALPSNNHADGVKTATANAALVVDGVTLAVGDRVLCLKEGADSHKENGLYEVTATGSGAAAWVLTRPVDYAHGSTQKSAACLVREGTSADHQYVSVTDGAPVISTTAVQFSAFSSPGMHSAGSGLSLSGKEFSISADGVDNTMIASNAVNADSIGPGAVGASELADDAVDTNALQDNCVNDDKCNFTNIQGTSANLSGSCTANSFISNSDRTLKANIEPVAPEAAHEFVNAMQACRYVFRKEPEQIRYGVIAQDLEEHPMLSNFVRKDAEGQRSVCYQDMIALLAASLKDMCERVSLLEAGAGSQSD